MEYVTGSDLFAHMQESKFNDNTTRFFSAQIVLVIEYLHSQNIVFRDLKPENLLVDWRGYLKLTDFSFSKHIPEDRTMTFCGSPCYMAPEIVLQEGHGKSVDWWSLGVLIYEMLAGRPTFDDEDVMQLYTSILTKEPEYDPTRFSPDAIALCSELLNKDPEQRLGAKGAQEIKTHPYFESINWEEMLHRKSQSPLTTYLINAAADKIYQGEETQFLNGKTVTEDDQKLFVDW
eukprot:c21254_g1_i3.p1 GENE.c21254_g1_i3~~c21254_g1_i3.p1  ORF type:complete len:232 (+),score=76.00 c21254_g1_i3:549-1244(+)